GGTAVGTLLKDALAKAGLLVGALITIIVGNSDDGGYSFVVVKNANVAGYGILPPPGDQMNALVGFAGEDKRRYLLSDQGRLNKNDSSLVEGVFALIEKTVLDEGAVLDNRVLHIANDFGLFALGLLIAVNNLDKKSEELAKDASLSFEKNRFVPIDGASVRNLILWGFLENEGFFSDNTKQDTNAVADPEAENAYDAATQKAISLLGVVNTQQLAGVKVSVSSFTPHTLYTIHKGWHVLLRKGPDTYTITIDKKNNGFVVAVPSSRGAEILRSEFVRPNERISLPDHLGIDVNLNIRNNSGALEIFDEQVRYELVEDAQKHSYLTNDKETIRIAADGTGRNAVNENKTAKDPVITLTDGTGVYFRSRLMKMQTNITETLNYSELQDIDRLDQRMFAGEIPAERLYLEAGNVINEIAQAKEGDLIIIGPGSFFTSILPHFFVRELPFALRTAKANNAKALFVFGANYDNETVNVKVQTMVEKIEEKAGMPFEKMFTHAVIGRSDILDLSSENEILQGIAQGEKAAAGKPEEEKFIHAAYAGVIPAIMKNLERRISTGSYHGLDLIEKYLRDITKKTGDLKQLYEGASTEEREQLKIKLATLVAISYYERHPELRTDASQASEAAKKSIAMLVLTAADRAYLQAKLGNGLVEISANSYIMVPKRKQGEYTLRIGYDYEILAESLKDIAQKDGGVLSGKELFKLEVMNILAKGYQLFVCADMDGSLTLSRTVCLDSTAQEIAGILRNGNKFAIISGAEYERIIWQILEVIERALGSERYLLKDLYILPANGAQLYAFNPDTDNYELIYKCVMADIIGGDNVRKIKDILADTVAKFGLTDAQINDFDSELVLRGSSKHVTEEEKLAFDPDGARREIWASYIRNKCSEENIVVDVMIAGSTSIDIVPCGLNKGFGINKITEFSGIPLESMVFLGDSFGEYGNDVPAAQQVTVAVNLGPQGRTTTAFEHTLIKSEKAGPEGAEEYLAVVADLLREAVAY
ncbi:MAG: 2-phospho-L-lactate transferase CofD family protein, partial [Candidatus Omnitrophica bacterium]|nr:2-phospho-L-lactate transferase CofD family protein [Candidatus Omnitrophota bacterium]